MKSCLAMLCWLYNELRDLKVNTWKEQHVSLNDDDLRLAALKKRRRDQGLQRTHSQVVQHVATRVYTAFKNYFEGRARFPKRKKVKKYRSLTYPQSGFKLRGSVVEKGKRTELRGKLYLSKIGYVRIFMHTPLEGKVRNLTIKYEAGEWYAIFICEVPDHSKRPLEQIANERIKGGDLGLLQFLTLSDGSNKDYARATWLFQVASKSYTLVIEKSNKTHKSRLSYIDVRHW
ncbi:MAG: putative transposase [Candidatus Bathyarchaeota archaeon BA1]|nr:MAG: putative transposase [Candidatus Bathyarchaeota archaeon BA1]